MRIQKVLIGGALAALAGAAACTHGPVLQSNAPADLVVVATTDIHGRARGWDYYLDEPDTLRGLSRVKTIVDSIRRVSPLLPVVVAVFVSVLNPEYLEPLYDTSAGKARSLRPVPRWS